MNAFDTAVASVSDDAPNSIVVHAEAKWTADFSGSVAANGTYTPTTAAVTGDSKFALISDATGGQDARDAGFETFEPRFNGGATYRWTPNHPKRDARPRDRLADWPCALRRWVPGP